MHINRRLSVVPEHAPRRLARSTVLVMTATLASMGLGFAREVVTARFFGASWELDAYLAALVVPTILFGVFNGALVSALVPVFSSYVARGREQDAIALATTLITVIAVLLSIAAALGWWLAPAFVPLIVHFPQERLALTTQMTRWLIPTIVATSLSGILAAILNAHSRFAVAAFGGAALNMAVIAAVVLGFGRFGMWALVLGTVLGFFAQLALQMSAFVALGARRWSVDLRHPGLRCLWIALGPVAVGSAAGQVALFFDRFFASGLPEGSISGMNYAVKIVGFPQQLFVTAIATVIFPVLATYFAHSNRIGMRRSVATGLRMVIFLTVPSALGLCMLAGPIVQTLFERGAFTPDATVLCTSLLPYAAVGLVALAANVILTRCTFACRQERATVAISLGSVLLNILLSVLLLPALGARGLLLANAMSQTGQTIALGCVVWEVVGGFDLIAIGRSFAKVLGCSALMVGALMVVQTFESPVQSSELARIVSLGEHLFFGAALFLGLARLVDSEEVHLVIELLSRRQRRPVDLYPLP